MSNKRINTVMALVIALSAIGLVMILSSSFVSAEMNSRVADGFLYFKRQLLWLAISLVAMLTLANIDYHFWGKHYRAVAIAICVLLVCTLTPFIGTSINGAKRWIRLFGVGIQASEFAKLAIIIFIAGFVAANPARIKSFKHGFLPVAGMIAVLCLLIIVEPDVGTTIFVALTGGVLALMAGMRFVHVLPALLLMVPPVIYLVLTKFEHVQSRLMIFMNPEADVLGKGHQIKQSLIALGSGGLFGSGIGMSKQKLFFLPEEFTDFILAVIGEEMGFAGTMVILFLFALLIWHCRKIVLNAPDRLGFFLAFGITFIISVQAIMNVAVVTASMPTKGISLPFISFGGSSLLVMMSAVGILSNIAKQSSEQPVRAVEPVKAPAPQTA